MRGGKSALEEVVEDMSLTEAETGRTFESIFEVVAVESYS